MNTRDMIGEFQRAFQRPISDVLVKNPSPEDRLLLANILFEEVVETIEKGLGVRIAVSNDHAYEKDFIKDGCQYSIPEVEVDGKSPFALFLPDGSPYDPIETADGLGDINVVIHFNAHWLGMNLDRITQEINDSNMSKLAEDGTPIINGVTPGYHISEEETPTGYRTDLPIGKILKGPNFRKPDIAAVIGICPNVGCPLEGKPHRHSDSMEQSMTREGPGVHVDSAIITPGAALDHCSEHPDQTTANCEGGFGLAGGGYGAYSICGKCGNVFGKTDDGQDF